MEELLIKKVKEHEVLYNPEFPDYRAQRIRQTAWEKIARELQIPANQAKEQWENLRRCFCNARKRHRDSTTNGTGIKKEITWKYSRQMSFILPHLESRRTRGNINKSEAAEPEESQAAENLPNQSERIHIEYDTESERGVQNGQAANDESASNNDKNVLQKSYKFVKRSKRKLPSDTPARQILKKSSPSKNHEYEEKNKCSSAFKTAGFLETLDDTDMFFLSMSRMTKQLPKAEQANIKLELSNSVLTAELKYNQPSFTSTHRSQHSFYTDSAQKQPFCQSSSRAPSSVQMTSPSENSSQGDED